jgi:hypothetical protein
VKEIVHLQWCYKAHGDPSPNEMTRDGLYDDLVLTIFSFLFSLLYDKQAAQSENL